MKRDEEIRKIILALETYWREHKELSLEELINSIKADDAILEDKALYEFLMHEIKGED